MATSPIREVIQRLRSIHLREGTDLTDGQLLERFLSRREPAALESLVHRHGNMVWGVCRRLLNQHDAEDAFQATFLVLVRKAPAIFPRSKVGNWLYGVAHQTALKARATRARRMERERQVENMPEPAVSPVEHAKDLLALLDQEVSRLPEKYRTAIVLCELGGKTAREAAQHLGCAEGTVASRLTRGRGLLRKRLTRRGLAVAGNAFTATFANNASASVPTALLSSTIKVITTAATGQTAAAGLTSVSVAALSQQVIKAMFLNKLMNTAVLLLALATLTGTAGLVYHGQANGSPQVTTKSSPTKGEAADNQQSTDDLARLQGTWRLVKSESDGLTMDEGRPEIKDSLLMILRSSVTMTGTGFNSPGIKPESFDMKMVGKVTLDTKKSPRGIVFTWEANPNPFLNKEPFTQRGIYALDGDTLKLCFYFAGKGLDDLIPTEFSAGAGSKRNVATWQRVTPSDSGKEKRQRSDKSTSRDLGNIQPPGGLPLMPGRGGVEITGEMVRNMTRRLEPAPAGELDKWVAELERIMGQKLDGELAKQGCRTYFVTRMSVAFDGPKWNAGKADDLFKRAQAMPASEARAWKEAFEALFKKAIGQTDKEVSDGGPAYAVPLVLIPVKALHKGQNSDAESSKKYLARLKQLNAEDVSLWQDKVDRFGGTRFDAAVNIVLLDDYFNQEKFQRDNFKAAIAALKTDPHSAGFNEADEMARLQGAWQLVGFEVDGLTVNEGRSELKGARLLFEQTSLTFSAPATVIGSAMKQAVAQFKLDGKRTPRVIVLTWKECPWNRMKDFVSRAIYTWEGERLRLCLNVPRKEEDKEAPRDFSAKVGSERLQLVFKPVPRTERQDATQDAQQNQRSTKQGKAAPAVAAADYLIEFRRLNDELQNLDESVMKKYTAAKSEAEREAAIVDITRVLKEKGTPLVDKALSLVRPHAADKEAVEVLTWILNQQPVSEATAIAANLLARHHLQDPQTLDTASGFQHAPMAWTEPLLRKLADADLPRERKVRALICLAVCAKTRAEMPGMFEDLDPAMRSAVEERYGKKYFASLCKADPAKVEAEAIRRFEELAHDYGSEKYGDRTVKDYAEGSLFEIRHLAVGKPAPDIEGEDIEGKKCKLSDYRGKVVLLDFWGNW